MDKPRELWILTNDDILPPTVLPDQYSADHIIAMTKRSNRPDSVHVIEYSAYESAIKERDLAINNYESACDCLAEARKERDESWAAYEALRAESMKIVSNSGENQFGILGKLEEERAKSAKQEEALRTIVQHLRGDRWAGMTAAAIQNIASAALETSPAKAET